MFDLKDGNSFQEIVNCINNTDGAITNSVKIFFSD